MSCCGVAITWTDSLVNLRLSESVEEDEKEGQEEDQAMVSKKKSRK